MKMMLACLTLALAANAAARTPPRSRETPQVAPTVVNDRAALDRLQRNSGITLQWISWDYRGQVRVTNRAGVIRLSGSQAARSGAGNMTLEGDVVCIDPRSFTFRGRIVITDTPDPGRNCVRDGTFEFRATGTRRYWRLQDIEACGGLADYVDIYF